jgi:hypothetical protein
MTYNELLLAVEIAKKELECKNKLSSFKILKDDEIKILSEESALAYCDDIDSILSSLDKIIDNFKILTWLDATDNFKYYTKQKEKLSAQKTLIAICFLERAKNVESIKSAKKTKKTREEKK